MKRLKTLCILLAVVLTLTSVTLLPVSAETDAVFRMKAGFFNACGLVC